MHKLNALEFTQKKIDTTMAENFIKECHGPGYDEWPEPDSMFIQTVGKMKTNCCKTDWFRFSNQSNGYELDCDTAKRLAKKIEESMEMFIQLEYLARGTDERDVREGHVKLISQLLRCNDALWNLNRLSSFSVTRETPLYILGAVAGCINGRLDITCISVTDKSMRYLCQYFVKLCHEVGFYIPLICCDTKTYANLKSYYEIFTIFWTGTKCTGVITEWSDIDSAIDAFIDSSITAPWRLQQIYVQENIFEDFKNALAVKTDLPASSQQFALGNKIMLVECLAPKIETSGHISIPVQAYRTTKELLSLLETQKTQYLSLWAANSALSNEIALHCSALTVWVNGFGSFEGPPRSALSVYNLNYRDGPQKINSLEIMLKSWMKIPADERVEKIVKALDSGEHFKEFRDFALKWRSSDFVHVTDKSICIGLQRQMDVFRVEELRVTDMLQIIKVLINGNGVIVECITNCRDAVDKLNQAGIPIADCDDSHGTSYDQEVPIIMERMKVIRTNYGTIFAN